MPLSWPCSACSARASSAPAPTTWTAPPGNPPPGPGTNPGGLGGFLVPFVKEEAPKLRLVTHHYYRGSGTAAASTMDKLLSADAPLVRVLQTLAAAANEGHVPDGFRVAETAS